MLIKIKKTQKSSFLLLFLLIVSCSGLIPENINSQNESSKQNYSDKSELTKYSVNGAIINSRTNQRIKDALIRINGNSTKTDNDGLYSIDNLNDSKITIVISKEGFITYTEDKELKSNNKTIDFLITPNNIIDSPIPTITPVIINTPIATSTPIQKNYLSGYLLEETTKKPLALTALKINNISAITDKNGYFYFSDLPKGSQTIYEYLNGLDKDPDTQTIYLNNGKNEINLYYISNSNPVTTTPISTPTIIPTVTPIPTTTPKILTEQEKKQITYEAFTKRKAEILATILASFYIDNQLSHDEITMKPIKQKLYDDYNTGKITALQYSEGLQDFYIKDYIYYEHYKSLYTDPQKINEYSQKLSIIYSNFSDWYRIEHF